MYFYVSFYKRRNMLYKYYFSMIMYFKTNGYPSPLWLNYDCYAAEVPYIAYGMSVGGKSTNYRGDRVCHVALYAYIRYYHEWCPMCSEVTYRGIVVMTEIARPHHRWPKTGRWSWFPRVPLDICFMTEDWFMILWVYLWIYDYVMNEFYDAYNFVSCFQVNYA